MTDIVDIKISYCTDASKCVQGVSPGGIRGHFHVPTV